MQTDIVKNDYQKIVEILQKGGIIVYPTETCYGLGVDAENKEVVYKLKGRSEAKKISVAVSDIEMAKKYFQIDKKTERIIRKFMPGPLTLVINGKSFRIPKNKTALEIVRRFGKPITSTSANISGKDNIYKISEIKKLFLGKVDIIVDGGNLPKRKPSTVFDVDSQEILRKGPITKKQLEPYL